MSAFRWAPALVAGVALATRAQAGPLTYDAALERAVASAPSLEATRLEADAARQAARAAGALPDPKLNVAVEGFPVSGPNAGHPSRDDFSDVKVGVMQDVPNAARRRAEATGARAAISQADAGRLAEARKVKVATALAWIDLAYSQRRLDEAALILATLPFALTGGVWALYLLGYHQSVATGVGFIALAGVSAEFGVVMLIYLDHALAERGPNPSPEDVAAAVREGALLRVRPKAMTVAVILAGLAPILVGHGAGSEVMSRIAAPMIGGMLTAPLLSMLVIPAGYLLLRRRGRRGASP